MHFHNFSQKTLGHVFGNNIKSRLKILGMLAAPLIWPVSIPGMSTCIGFLCLITSIMLWINKPILLPIYLHNYTIPSSLDIILNKILIPITYLIQKFSKIRYVHISRQKMYKLHAFFLVLAGLSMMMPIPFISFDNVIPAISIVLITWGVVLKDGIMIILGYIMSMLAWILVGFLMYGGVKIFEWLI